MARPVLIVDDDPAIRALIAAVLEDDGFGVVTAANGREALACIAQLLPALVLLDLQMPVMSGWELLAHLRADQVAVPVVFMTAGYRAQAEAERHHADGYLAKPFELAELVAVVERFVPPLAS